MTILLDGKAVATKHLIDLAGRILPLDKKPKLAVIMVGENPASQVYVKLKQKRAEAVGIESLLIPLPEETTTEHILEHIDILNEDSTINAILVQLPLPEHIDTGRVLLRIAPHKDVDGFNPVNAGMLAIGGTPTAYPCTPLGIVRLLNEYKINISGKHAVVIGRSNIVGKPLSYMLLEKNATVTVCHSKTQNLSAYTKTADILISAVGQRNLVTQDMVKPNAIVIDVGVSKDEDGKLCGDVDFQNVSQIAGAITPNPGGVGPMTIATLLENTYRLYNLQQGK
ncbi:bifunctional 5,10-methylenetetrahydrofolate dehydrogenase/5,10-methenyltetrahydrofolate cyclohydrolase [bacterium]|nr:bifunctional 5,10-methylenetetrahydrofolate dehydrogenase/5,10-methenyltetrahydrofolate cyclohydrolase [bacterium]